MTPGAYEARLDAVPALVPAGVQGVFWADRGFADTALFAHLRRLGGPFRMRMKAHCSVQRPGPPECKIADVVVAPGRALFLHPVAITAESVGPVSVAWGRHTKTGESGYIVSDEPTSVHPFEE